jgi:tRNA-dihydrouridine synthase A
MAAAAKIVEQYGYDEVNLNCGCPSNKVAGKGCFGARLMFDPSLVAKIISAMKEAVSIPVTVKCRLGVDDRDKWEEIKEFVKVVSEEGGATKFIIHARKCHLKGLDPK